MKAKTILIGYIFLSALAFAQADKENAITPVEVYYLRCQFFLNKNHKIIGKTFINLNKFKSKQKTKNINSELEKLYVYLRNEPIHCVSDLCKDGNSDIRNVSLLRNNLTGNFASFETFKNNIQFDQDSLKITFSNGARFKQDFIEFLPETEQEDGTPSCSKVQLESIERRYLIEKKAKIEGKFGIKREIPVHNFPAEEEIIVPANTK